MKFKRAAALVFALSMTMQTFPAFAAETEKQTAENNNTVELLSLYSYEPYSESSYKLTYMDNGDGTLSISGLEGSGKGKLIIPGKINGKTVTTIGAYAFSDGCEGFTGDLIIPEGVKNIEKDAFLGCKGINGKIYIPSSLESIYMNPFGCNSTGFNVSPQNAVYSAVNGILMSKNQKEIYICPSNKTSELNIPNDIVKIFPFAFAGCNRLTGSLNIPDSVEFIGEYAFANCTGLKGSLKIGNNVKYISRCAFLNCSGLTGSIIIPSSVEFIDAIPFSECNGLGDVYFEGNAPEVNAADKIYQSFDSGTILHYIEGTSGWTTPYWNGYKCYPYVKDEAQDNASAEKLFKLGLFQGVGTYPDGTPNFDLSRTPTRNEAITMLVRLLGKEQEANSQKWYIPFTDSIPWAEPYVGYAYKNGLTIGTSATTFHGNNPANVSQYLTFILRALGYSSETDFRWDRAWELTDKLGITNGEYNINTKNFVRGDVADISLNALFAYSKGTNKTLLEKLIEAGAVPSNAKDILEGKPEIENSLKPYVPVIEKAIYEDKDSYMPSNGFFVDMNGDGIKEMAIAKMEMKAGQMPFYGLSIYTLNAGNVITLKDKENITYVAGAPSCKFNAANYNGKRVVKVQLDNGETGYGAERETTTTVYSYDGYSTSKLLTLKEAYREDGEDYTNNFRNPYAWEINGKSVAQSEYNSIYLNIIDDSVKSMTLKELLSSIK